MKKIEPLYNSYNNLKFLYPCYTAIDLRLLFVYYKPLFIDDGF